MVHRTNVVREITADLPIPSKVLKLVEGKKNFQETKQSMKCSHYKQITSIC